MIKLNSGVKLNKSISLGTPPLRQLATSASEYKFVQAMSTYYPLTEGTTLSFSDPYVENPVWNAIDIGFTFKYMNTQYNKISIAENGFLAMGGEVITSNLPLSGATGTNNAMSAFGRDLRSRLDLPLTKLSHTTVGSAPNRICVVQWENFRRSHIDATNDILNFQIQLHEGSNEVVFCYGNVTAINIITAATVQVGLRGASSDDYNNRSTMTDWTATTRGTANNSSCRISDTIYPPSGLKFMFIP